MDIIHQRQLPTARLANTVREAKATYDQLIALRRQVKQLLDWDWSDDNIPHIIAALRQALEDSLPLPLSATEESLGHLRANASRIEGGRHRMRRSRLRRGLSDGAGFYPDQPLDLGPAPEPLTPDQEDEVRKLALALVEEEDARRAPVVAPYEGEAPPTIEELHSLTPPNRG
jgi:hypothetical protein